MIDGMDESNGERKRTAPRILSPDNPFPMRVPGVERAGLKRNVTKEQCVDLATRIAYGMCQQLFEVLNTKHSTAIEKVTTELRAEIDALRGVKESETMVSNDPASTPHGVVFNHGK